MKTQEDLRKDLNRTDEGSTIETNWDDKFFYGCQLAMAITMFGCVVVGIISQMVRGFICSFGGVLFSITFVLLFSVMLRLAWGEYKEHCSK